MKLLLSDGTVFGISSYGKTVATLNGDTVDAVSFSIEKSTLDKVRTAFNDESRLNTIKVYTDNNVLKETYTGYQVRNSIALGETDDTFTVVVSKSSEVSEQIKALDTAVSSAISVMAELTDAVEAIKSKFSDIVEKNLEELSQNAKAQLEKYNEINGHYEKMVAATGDYNFSTDAYKLEVSSYKEQLIRIAGALESVSAEYQIVKETVSSINENIAKAYSDIHEAATDFEAKQGSISTMEAQMKEVLESNQNSMNGFNETTRTAQNLATKCDTLAQEAKTFASTVEETGKSYQETQKQISEMSQQIQDDMKKAETARDTQIKEMDEKITTDIQNVSDRLQAIEPVSDITTLPLEEAKVYRVVESQDALADYLLTHPIASNCHGGKVANYAITADKQSYLQAMIMMTTTALANGIEYQPSWNATGESCTYDWTLEELQQLAIEIEATVRPLISHQQTLEKKINAAKSMNRLMDIEISYEGISPNPIIRASQPDDTENSAE